MKQIELTQGLVTIVDDADYEELSKHKWYARRQRHLGNFYAIRNESGRKIYMHRQILGLKPRDNRHSDHRNHITLDNRRDNIRICTCQENMRNRKPRLNTTSGYKGVYRHTQAKKWVAQITIKGVIRHLGLFKIEKEAAVAYDKAAKKYFGEFACLNLAKN